MSKITISSSYGKIEVTDGVFVDVTKVEPSEEDILPDFDLSEEE